MALLFHPNIRNLYLGRGVAAAFAGTWAMSIYSGEQPAAAQISSNWQLYNEASAGFLAHYLGAAWTQPSNGLLLQLVLPTAVIPVRSGVATWAILWATNVTVAATQGTTLPNASFMVVACSTNLEQGVIRFVDPTMTAGVSKSIIDGSIGAYLL